MDLLICSLYNCEETDEAKHHPVGEITYQNDTLILRFYMFFDCPVIAVLQSQIETETTARSYILKSEKVYLDKYGEEQLRLYVCGSMKIRKNGLVYVNLNFLPHGRFQVIDPEKVMLKEMYLEG